MFDLLEKEKKELDKSEQQVKQSIIKSTCHKIVEKQHKDMLCTADINNDNENEWYYLINLVWWYVCVLDISNAILSNGLLL